VSHTTTSLHVSNQELATVREAMREMHRLLAALEQDQLEKIVLTQKNQMRAVLNNFRALQPAPATRPLSAAQAGDGPRLFPAPMTATVAHGEVAIWCPDSTSAKHSA